MCQVSKVKHVVYDYIIHIDGLLLLTHFLVSIQIYKLFEVEPV